VADQPWLQLDDELLLDDTDYRVMAVLVGRTERMGFQRLTLAPQLGGDERTLLQLEDAFMEAAPLDPEVLAGEQLQLGGDVYQLRWDGEVQTERATLGGSPKFGRGRCAWYASEDGAVAVLIVERYERVALTGQPLEPSRIDLRFTVGLREERE
jgi:hypothetical protein